MALGVTLGVLVALFLLFTLLGYFYPDNELLTSGYFADLLFKGIVLGSVYALIALGYTMVYGVIQLINFAHGEIYMLGAYFGYFALRFYIDRFCFGAGLPLWLAFIMAMLTAMILCAICGMAMEKFAYLPLRKSTRIAVLIIAVGMSFFLQNLGLILFSANPRSFAPNTFVVYTVEADSSESFCAPIRKTVYNETNTTVPLPGDVCLRIRARSQQGESGWSETLFVASDSLFESIASSDDAGDIKVPSPPGLSANREGLGGDIKVTWTEIPKSARDIKPIFADVPKFIPLDFGIGANRSETGGSRRFGFNVAEIHIVILITTMVMLGALYWLINFTRFGIAMRAVSFDKETTRLMGIDTDTVISLTFALGSSLAAVAGCLVGLYLIRIDPLMGVLPGIKAFVAAVVGGIGSIPGAAAGGLIMGVSETLVKGYIPSRISPLSDAVAFAFLIIVLLVKPTGLFGKAAKEKV
jgi:branched-chain amino acid transport system permease protein